MFDGIQNNATGDGLLFYFNPILFRRYSKPQVHDWHQSKENDDFFALALLKSLKKPKRFSTKPEREQAAFVVAIIQSYELTGR